MTQQPSERHVFEYVILRAVPRPERGESVNVGLILYCRDVDLLVGHFHLPTELLRALDPAIDIPALEQTLDVWRTMCEGGSATDEHRRPPDDALTAADIRMPHSLAARFRWLSAPRSTILQPTPPHTGLTPDPAPRARQLFQRLVMPSTRAAGPG